MNTHGPTDLGLTSLRRRLLLIGVVATAVPAVVLAAEPRVFLRGYLAAWLFCAGLSLGSLTLLMIYHLTGGAWGFLLRRTFEAAVGTLPLVALGFLPIALGVGQLYPWARPSEVADSSTLEHARIYLNPPFFWLRAGLLFAIWMLVGWLLRRWSRSQDTSRSPRWADRLTTLSGLGLVSYGVGLNFASADWAMSLDTGFHSTIFGPLFASGHLLSSLALAVVVLAWLRDRPPLSEIISPDVINDLGSLLFAFVVVWSYMVWFQFMLIWIANLPVDIIWYLARSGDSWRAVSGLLFVGAFVVPLFALLLKSIKRDLRQLARISVLILAMQAVYQFYLVLPSAPVAEPPMTQGLIVLLPFGLAALWGTVFLGQLSSRPLLPDYDFSRNEAVRLREKHEHELAEEAAIHG